MRDRNGRNFSISSTAPEHRVLVDSLHQTARTGDIDEFRTLLQLIPQASIRRVYVNLYDDAGATPLHYAVHYHHTDIVRQLITVGANVNSRTADSGQSPLHFACRHKKILRRRNNNNNNAVGQLAENQRRKSTDANSLALDTATSEKILRRRSNSFSGTPTEKFNTFDQQLPHSASTAHTTTRVQADLENNNSIVAILIAAGANVNSSDRVGHTPLHVAVWRNNESAVRDLLTSPLLRTDTVDRANQTVLHHAALQCRSPDIIRLLLTFSPCDNECHRILRSVDNNFNTPLHLACAQGNVYVARVLLAVAKQHYGREYLAQMLCDRDDESQVPLVLAVEGGHFDIAQLLIAENSPVDYANDQGDRALHIAAARGDIALCRLLIERGCATIDIRNLRLQTPLHRAAALNRLQVVEYLLSVSAQVNAGDRNAWTPLLLAAHYGHAKMLRVLLQAGANIFALSKHDRNAMYLAAANNHVNIVQTLLDYTSSSTGSGGHHREELLSRADRYGYLPIHIACWKGYIDVVKLIIATPQQQQHADDNEQSPHRRRRRLDERLDDDKTILHLAAMRGWLLLVKLIISNNNHLVHAEDEHGNTPLHLAALRGHTQTCAVLIKNGASSVAARNQADWTPLDCAASAGHTLVCKLLLKNEACIDVTDRIEQCTPLHRACGSSSSSSSSSHENTVRFLVEHGASLSASDINGFNCLDYAIEYGRRDIVKYLLADCGKWRKVLRSEQIVPGSHCRRQTPMRKLIIHMPDMALIALNKCMTTIVLSNKENDFAIKCCFEFIDDTFAQWNAADNNIKAVPLHARQVDKNVQSGNIKALTPPRRQADNSNIKGEPPTRERQAADNNTNAVKKKAYVPYSTNRHVLRNNHPLQVMVDHEQEALLTHPLTTSLIQTKWQLYGRYKFYFRLFTYSAFLLCWTAYCMCSNPINRLFYALRTKQSSKNQTFEKYWYSDFCINANNHTAMHWPLSPDVNELGEQQICRVLEEYRRPPHNCSMQFIKQLENDKAFFILFSVNQFVLPVLCVVLLVMEIVQACFLRRLGDNILACPLYICTIIVAVPWQGFTCFNQYGFMPSWEWQLSAFTLFLAYIQFTMHLRYFPWIGLYVQMLRDVALTVASFFPVFFLVIMAFTLGFFISFQSSVRHVQRADFFLTSKDDPLRVQPYYSLPMAAIKSLTFLTGEYEQQKHFFNNSSPVELYLYTIFVFVGTVIIVNLIIGLAVGNIKTMKDTATLRRIALRIDVVLSAEQLMPLWLLQRLWRREHYVYPNGRRQKNFRQKKFSLSSPKTWWWKYWTTKFYSETKKKLQPYTEQQQQQQVFTITQPAVALQQTMTTPKLFNDPRAARAAEALQKKQISNASQVVWNSANVHSAKLLDAQNSSENPKFASKNISPELTNNSAHHHVITSTSNKRHRQRKVGIGERSKDAEELLLSSSSVVDADNKLTTTQSASENYDQKNKNFSDNYNRFAMSATAARHQHLPSVEIFKTAFDQKMAAYTVKLLQALEASKLAIHSGCDELPKIMHE